MGMWLVGAVLLAVFVLPGAWEVPVVAAGAALEVADGLFWYRWSRRRRAAVGAEALIGEIVDVVERLDPDGRVKVKGELWNARTIGAEPVEPGGRARILALEGLTLVVRPED
jgi:membrane-bound serine protease (ClpP class)